MIRRFARGALCLAMLALAVRAAAAGLDPFLVDRTIAASATGTMLPNPDAPGVCRFGEPGLQIGLIEAVERVLCHNPKTREAWAEAKLRAAELGIRKSAYLPTISATAGLARQRSVTEYDAYPVLNSDVKPTLRSGSLKMSLVLSDFGLRSAYVDQARALLDSANETHDETLQQVFLEAAQAYFDNLSAKATLDAKQEAEAAARESFLAAQAKYKAGVAGLTDQLQASTAYEQAKLERVEAQGGFNNAQGSLAIAMGIKVDTPYTLLKPGDKPAGSALVKPVDELIEDARSHHPALIAARADIAAAEAGVSAVRAEGRPILSLTTELSRNEQLGQPPSLGLDATDIRARSSTIGIQLNVPLFEGFGRTYKVRAARSQVEAKQAAYDQLEQKVRLEVWKSYQLLTMETEALRTTSDLLDNARKSYEVARGRYRSGLGSMVELINVQSALADAEQRRIKAMANWHAARLRLAASIGKIGLWAIAGRPGGGPD